MLALALWMAATTPATPVRQLVEAPVLSRDVEKGDMLSPSDFTSAPLPPAAARGATPPDAAAGKEAVRRLSMGSPVRAADIATPHVIRRGEAVTIDLQSGLLRISSAGRALGNAAAGEPVRVLNLSTNRTLDAIAQKAGQVRIVMP